MTKDEAQITMLEQFKKWLLIYFQISMGVGKTRGSLNCAKWMDEKTRTETIVVEPRGLIVVHTAYSRDTTWPNEIKETHPWLLPRLKSGTVEIVHKDQVVNLRPTHYSWIIWDECHLIKREHFAFFNRNSFNSLIVMSGTEHDDSILEKALKRLVKYNFMKISVEQAVAHKLINDYRVKLIAVPMTDVEAIQHKEIAIRLTKARHVSHQVAMMVTGARMRFIYELRSKLVVMQRFVQMSPNRKLIFTSRKEDCNLFTNNIYHSDTDDTALKAFAEGRVNDLVSIKQIRTGGNFKNFDTIFSSQVNNKKSTFMQDLGRLFRLEVDQLGTIYAFYADDTQDMIWAMNATKDIPEEKKRIYKFDATLPGGEQIRHILQDNF
jgi:superfamily II DNA or RNA helicase